MQYNHASELIESTMRSLRNPPVGASLPWFPRMTEYMGGLRPHEVTLLCAPTGTGKTELLASVAAQLAGSGIQTFAAPVETGDQDFLTRVISIACKKNLNHGLQVEESILSEIETKHIEKIARMPLWIANYDNRVSIAEMTQVLQFAHESEGVQVALLDNLNFFLEVTKASDALLEMDNAIHSLVMFAKKIRMHTILVVHPKKTDGGRVDSEFDIKGSSTAVQECANIMLFNRPTQKQVDEGRAPNLRELVFKKIRKRGAYVNKPIWLSFQDGYYAEVKDAPTSGSGSQIALPIGRSYQDKRSLSAGRD